MIEVSVLDADTYELDYEAKLISFLYLPPNNTEGLDSGIYGMVIDGYANHWLVERDLIVAKTWEQK